MEGIRLIGLCGPAGAGKDTAASILFYEKWVHLAFADPIRKGVYAIDPWISYMDGYRSLVELMERQHGYGGYGRKDADRIVDGARTSPFYRWFPRGWLFIRLSSLIHLVGYDVAKQLPEVRRLLCKYGTEAGRDIHGSECWGNIAEDKIQEHLANGDRVVVTDVRVPHEVDVIHRNGGVVFEIARPGYSYSRSHSTENGVVADVVVHNRGTKHELRVNMLRALDGVNSKLETKHGIV